MINTMDITFFKDKIEFNKELNALDNFVIDFTSILNTLHIQHVIISGYVSILFGRSRTSEDIDLILEKMDFPAFNRLWKDLSKDFECIITDNPKTAYEQCMMAGHAIRFSRKKRYIPNMELKFPKIDLEEWVLRERKKVSVNNKTLFISPFELQISFKLFLGSEKDIEDARYLYRLFKDNLDMPLLSRFNRKLKIEEEFKRYLE